MEESSDGWIFDTPPKNFMTQSSKNSKGCSKVLSFSVSKASKEACSPPASPASVVGWFFFSPYLFPTPSKLHPLPIAIYILLQLQSVSSLCKVGSGGFFRDRNGLRLLWPFYSWINWTAATRGLVLQGSFRLWCLNEWNCPNHASSISEAERWLCFW